MRSFKKGYDMVRICKKERLKCCPRKPKYGAIKTGPIKDNLPKGYKEHDNVFIGKMKVLTFIGKVK